MHNEMEKCWICGKQASRTITKEQLFFEDSFGEYITDHQLTAKYNVTVGTNSITFSSTATSRSSAPGSFYNGTYIY